MTANSSPFRPKSGEFGTPLNYANGYDGGIVGLGMKKRLRTRILKLRESVAGGKERVKRLEKVKRLNVSIR